MNARRQYALEALAARGTVEADGITYRPGTGGDVRPFVRVTDDGSLWIVPEDDAPEDLTMLALCPYGMLYRDARGWLEGLDTLENDEPARVSWETAQAVTREDGLPVEVLERLAAVREIPGAEHAYADDSLVIIPVGESAQITVTAAIATLETYDFMEGVEHWGRFTRPVATVPVGLTGALVAAAQIGADR